MSEHLAADGPFFFFLLTVYWRASLDGLCPLISTLINMESCHELTCLRVSGNGPPLSRQLCNSLSSTGKCTPYACTLTSSTTGHLLKVKISSSLLIAVLVSQSVSRAPKKQMLAARIVFWQMRWLVSNEKGTQVYFFKQGGHMFVFVCADEHNAGL